MKMVEAIAKRLTDLLAEKGMSQYALASKALIDPSTLYNILYGRIKTVTIDTLWVISNAFDITIQDFLSHPLFAKDNIEI